MVIEVLAFVLLLLLLVMLRAPATVTPFVVVLSAMVSKHTRDVKK